jgi:hypothetical protein
MTSYLSAQGQFFEGPGPPGGGTLGGWVDLIGNMPPTQGMRIISGIAYEGAQSLRLKIPEGDTNVLFGAPSPDWVDVTEGAQVAMGVKVWRALSALDSPIDGTVSVICRTFDISDTPIADIVIDEPVADIRGSWIDVAGTLVIPSGVAKIAMLIGMELASAPTVGNWEYRFVDAITFEEVVPLGGWGVGMVRMGAA